MKKVLVARDRVFKWLLFDLSLVSLVFLGFKIITKAPEAPCANTVSCIKNLTGKYEPEKKGEFLGKSVVIPNFLAEVPNKKVLGETSLTGEKHIYVNLANQTLYAYQGSQLLYTFLISSGKWNRTPTGDFEIWTKLRYTKMSGGSQALHTYYYLPNVPFVMFFYNNEIGKSLGYSLHGTYWHDNFGHPMSHGCVNMRTADAETIYYWSNPTPKSNLTYASTENPGTTVTIYGTAPKE
jgi:hypothetical protein